MNALFLDTLCQRIAESELGMEFINDPLMNQDVWSIQALGFSEEELTMRRIKNIYFTDFSLPWLKLLAKLTMKATIRQKQSLSAIIMRITYLKQLDKFLLSRGYNQPELITDKVLEEFISQGSKENRKSLISYVTKIWADEQWLQLDYTPRKEKRATPKIETIPEEVLFQIYENFDLFPPPLERLFRLQLVIGCRLGEILMMPRQCLKKERDNWFLLRWIEKRKQWKFNQIHPLVAELVKEQQKFLDINLGSNFDFDRLFCKVSTAHSEGAKGCGTRFQREPAYLPKILSVGEIGEWLRAFCQKADLKDKHGNRFNLTSHQFRRTKASIMAYCEVEDEYIAAVLGHGSLDMLPHYRQRSLERLERETSRRGYVNKDGHITTFTPKKRRYEKLAKLLKVSIPLGECHRPIMLGDCQFRYSCLSCDHHRVTLDDKKKLEIDRQSLKEDLQQAKTKKTEKRVTEINRLLGLIETRLDGLRKLQKIKENTSDETE